MAFLGKEYKFVKQENFEDFVKALGLNAEQTQIYLNYAPSIKYTKDGDSYTESTATSQTKNETSFKSGVPYDDKVADRPCKTTITVDGDTVTRVQKYDDGNEVTITRQFSGNDLTVSLTTSKWNGVARRYYKA